MAALPKDFTASVLKKGNNRSENEKTFYLEGVLILRNSSLKLKTVVDNASLQNYAVSSENISKSIKIKTENGFYLKQNVCKFR
jgi:hypothetical protein